MKKILTIISFFTIALATAQEHEITTENNQKTMQNPKPRRWFYQGEVSVTFPSNNNAKYSYQYYNPSTNSYEGQTINISEQPIISSDFSVNYQLFRIFSIGAVGGLTHFQNPAATGFKLGGVLRLNPVKHSRASIYTQVAGFLPLSNLIKTSMGEAKFGFSVPILERKRYGMHLAMYTSFTGFEISKSPNPETPDDVEYRGIGFSFGVRF